MKILKLKLNHICCNPNCHKGDNGGRKAYFACDYCDRTNTWKSICCSVECYNEFMALGKKKTHNRIDKTESEVAALMAEPEESVKKRSVEELENAGFDTSNGISEAIDEVNKEIDAENERRKTVRVSNKKVDSE